MKFLDKLIESNKLEEFIQMKYNGVAVKDIALHFDVSMPTVYNTFKQINESKQVEPTKAEEQIQESIEGTSTNVLSEKETAYEKLYRNRKFVVGLKKQGKYNVEIARIMGVSDQDVFDFFDKRIKLTSQQIIEIKNHFTNGKTPEFLSEMYGANVETIKKICQQTIVKQENNNEVVEDVTCELDCIGKFYQLIHQIETKTEIVLQDEIKYEKRQQDLLHKLELEDYSDDSVLDFAKQMKEIRQKRRECKDFLQLVSPVTEFLKDETNAKPLKTLANLMGRVNNEAKKMGNRIYFMRTNEHSEE